MLRSFFLISTFLTVSTSLWAQSSVTITAPAVDEKAAMENRTTFVDPVYPPIAKAAHVTGTVVLQLEIEPDGTVGQVKIISGPEMLKATSVDAVKQWHYKPFSSEGSPSTVSTTVSIPFTLDDHPAENDFAIQSVFYPLSDKCHQAVSQNAAPAEQADTCRHAAEVAAQFAPNSRYIERRSIYTYASAALLRNNESKEALDFAEKAVTVSEAADDDGSGRSAVYSVRAQAKAVTGDLSGADQDFTRAENEMRAALDTLAGHQLHAIYTNELIGLLQSHAQLLQVEAQSKLDEAAKLQSH
jgi:TonB family protein